MARVPYSMGAEKCQPTRMLSPDPSQHEPLTWCIGTDALAKTIGLEYRVHTAGHLLRPGSVDLAGATHPYGVHSQFYKRSHSGFTCEFCRGVDNIYGCPGCCEGGGACTWEKATKTRWPCAPSSRAAPCQAATMEALCGARLSVSMCMYSIPPASDSATNTTRHSTIPSATIELNVGERAQQFCPSPDAMRGMHKAGLGTVASMLMGPVRTCPQKKRAHSSNGDCSDALGVRIFTKTNQHAV